MKIKDKLVLRKIADNWVILPLAASTFSLNGVLKLNDTGALLWQKLEQGADYGALIDSLINEYDIPREIAEDDVEAFLFKLHESGCIEE